MFLLRGFITMGLMSMEGSLSVIEGICRQVCLHV
jgi:hypothetical protein